MTELEKLQAETENLHAKLKVQISELKAQHKELPKPPHPRWKPEEGEYYYWFTGQGTPSQDKWVASACDRDLYNIGNVFLDLKTAEFAAERLKVLAEMREWAGKWSDPYRIIYIDGRVEPETVYVGRCISYGELRFGSEDDAKNCIKAVGEGRLKKYYFGITEENGCDHEDFRGGEYV